MKEPYNKFKESVIFLNIDLRKIKVDSDRKQRELYFVLDYIYACGFLFS